MKKSFKKFLIVATVFLLVLMVPGTIGAEEKGGELHFAYSQDPPSLDVARTPSTSFVHELIYETLVIYGFDNQYHGQLAESWEIKDGGKEVTFKLKKNIFFHDGTPLNAEAVAFNFERLMDPEFASPGAGQLETYKGVRVDGEYEVTLLFEKPISSLFYNLSQQFFAIQSPAAIKKFGEDYGQKAAVGTGPFKFESWQPGDKIVLVRNEDYNWAPYYFENRGPAYLEKVVLHNMPDPMTRFFALQQGKIHFSGVAPEHIQMIKGSKDLQVDVSPIGSVVYLGLNSSKWPWSDVRVRRAIAHSIDREEIVQQGIEGYGVANPTPLSPTVLAHDKDLYSLAPEEDIEKGKALLRKAGFKETADGWVDKDGNELVLEIMTYSSDPWPKLAQIIREQIIRLGIEVKIVTLESGTLLSKTPSGEHDAICIAYGWSDPDILTYFFHSKNLDRTNRVHYVNPEIDRLLDKAQTIIDQEERIAIYKEIQEILIKDAPWICLYTPYDLIAVRKELKGFKREPRGSYLILDAYIEN